LAKWEGWKVNVLPGPDLPIFEVAEGLFESNFFVRNMAAVGAHAGEHERLVVGGEESTVFRERRDDGPAGDADADCAEAFNNEDPAIFCQWENR
jgi:hypothetical protein